MQGTLFHNIPDPRERLRMHLTLCMWHAEQARRLCLEPIKSIDAVSLTLIAVNATSVGLLAKQALRKLGGMVAINLTRYV